VTSFLTSFLVNASAEEMATFYTSVFPNSSIDSEFRATDGSMIVVHFTLDGLACNAINAGQDFPFTSALSTTVRCGSQAAVDHLWDGLTNGGTPGQCGWLTDRFGVSWQIVPEGMEQFVGDPNPARAAAAMNAMLAMSKLDLGLFAAAVEGVA